MKIQYLSDLHLEFPRNRQWLLENPIEPNGDILIVAGDTFNLGAAYKEQPYFDYLSKHFESVYLLPGNHEYYGGYDVATSGQEVKEQIRDNVWLVNNTVVELDAVELVFSILWSKVEKYPREVARGMSDFRWIRYEGAAFTVERYNQLFDQCLDFLKGQIFESTNKTRIVVSHHLPSEWCSAKEFAGGIINEGFCTDLTEMIKKANIDYWIYGHSHRNIPSFEIDGTKMLTNQLGYVKLGEHWDFRRGEFLEL